MTLTLQFGRYNNTISRAMEVELHSGMFKKTPHSWEWNIVYLHPFQMEASAAGRLETSGKGVTCECVCLGKREDFDVSRRTAGVIEEVSSAAS